MGSLRRGSDLQGSYVNSVASVRWAKDRAEIEAFSERPYKEPLRVLRAGLQLVLVFTQS